MDKYPICCCCAEDNQRVYLDRILFWAGQFGTEPFLSDYELHVFCDGGFKEDTWLLESIGAVLHPQDKIGRSSVHIFQSYKRSFLNMCKMFPNGFSVCENDVLLLGKTKFAEYTKQQGLFCGFSHKYNFIETALMVINDNDCISRFASHYEKDGAIYKDEDFEVTLTRLAREARKNFNTVFVGERKEKDASFDHTGDYVAQYFG